MKPPIPARYSIPFLLSALLCCARGTLLDFVLLIVFCRYLGQRFSFF
jgi:hypothetical protein